MQLPGMRLLLRPFSFLYGLAVRTRVILYRGGVLRMRRLKGKVISVGNLTVGGTGKTPMVIWLAEKLIEQSVRPAILTRGYRGDEKEGVAADEVALIKARLGGKVQLGVGKNRYESGRILGRHGAGWFVLDDGFQHLALERDANILLLDAIDAFGGGRLLPSGRLREPLSAIRRADIVVITRTDRAPALESIVRRYSQAPLFYAQTELESVLRAPRLDLEWLMQNRSSARVFAFCGIGNPRGFFDDLGRWGFQVVGERFFRDHHRYSEQDLLSLEKEARSKRADALICTEKDVFNLQVEKIGALPVYACRIRMQISKPEEFWKGVQLSIARHATVKPS